AARARWMSVPRGLLCGWSLSRAKAARPSQPLTVCWPRDSWWLLTQIPRAGDRGFGGSDVPASGPHSGVVVSAVLSCRIVAGREQHPREGQEEDGEPGEQREPRPGEARRGAQHHEGGEGEQPDHDGVDAESCRRDRILGEAILDLVLACCRAHPSLLAIRLGRAEEGEQHDRGDDADCCERYRPHGQRSQRNEPAEFEAVDGEQGGEEVTPSALAGHRMIRGRLLSE